MTEQKKPRCKLVGTDGNIFALVGKAGRTLKRAGLHKEEQEMKDRVFASKSYHEALGVIMDYVEAE